MSARKNAGIKVIMSMCMSLNGFVAREDGREDWLPAEGWYEFLAEAKSMGNFITGRQSYELVTKHYNDFNFDDVETGYKLIVSANRVFEAPTGYTVVHSPTEALSFLAGKGANEALLIGGGKLNAAFLESGLVDEIRITTVPFVLGSGRPFVGAGIPDVALTLLESKALSLGRIRNTYRVEKAG